MYSAQSFHVANDKHSILARQIAEDLFSDPSDINGTGSGEYITLPDPDISNLAEIEHLIKEAQSGANEKEKLAAFIIMDVCTLTSTCLFYFFAAHCCGQQELYIRIYIYGRIITFNCTRATLTSCSQSWRLAKIWTTMQTCIFCTTLCSG